MEMNGHRKLGGPPEPWERNLRPPHSRNLSSNPQPVTSTEISRFTYLLHGTVYYLKSWLLLSSSKNIPLSYGTRSFITVFTKARHWTLSWASYTRHFETFRNNKKIFTVRGCRPHSQPPSWRTTPVGCPRLIIQYIRSYPPYPEDFPPSATWGRAMPWWQGTHLTWNITVQLKQTLKYSCSCALSEHRAIKACWGSGGIAPLIPWRRH
jgi:hypothetical protein